MAKASTKPAADLAEPKAPKKIGRPSTFTQEVADRICAALETGKSLRSICENDDTLPHRDTVIRWLKEKPVFYDHYTRARSVGFDALAELAIDEASAYIKPEDVPAARVKLDARKWYLGKMAPRKYGDKVEIDSRNVTAVVDMTPQITDEQRSRALTTLMAKIKAKRDVA